MRYDIMRCATLNDCKLPKAMAEIDDFNRKVAELEREHDEWKEKAEQFDAALADAEAECKGLHQRIAGLERDVRGVDTLHADLNSARRERDELLTIVKMLAACERENFDGVAVLALVSQPHEAAKHWLDRHALVGNAANTKRGG